MIAAINDMGRANQLPVQVTRLAEADVSGDCSAPLARFELAAIVACCQPGFPLHGVLVASCDLPTGSTPPNDGSWLCTTADGWPLEAQHPHLINARRHTHDVSQQG